MTPEAQAPRVDGRRLRHAHRRPELVGLAADYLLEHGLADVSLRPLSAAMGLSHRGVLHHFGSKEALLVEAVEEVRRREQERLGVAAEARAEPTEVLRLVWRRISAPEHLPYARLHFELQAAAQRLPETYGRFLDDLVGSWVELIAGLLVARGVGPSDAPPLATFVYAAVRGLQLDLLATGDRDRVNGAFEELARVLDERLTVG